MYNSPLEQFRATNYLNIYTNYLDLSITKTTIYLIIASLIILIMLSINSTENKIITNRFTRIFEIVYEAWDNQIKDILGNKGKNYVALIISIFLFIASNNLIGLIPYSYTTTAQIIVTLTLSLSIFIGVTLTGIYLQGFHFINLFIPSGMPLALLPFLFIIEVISYFFRIISLSVRLSGNLIAGHCIFKILSSLGLKLSSLSVILILLPFTIIFLLVGLEIGVALIQAYVFSILTTIYIKDAVYGH